MIGAPNYKHVAPNGAKATRDVERVKLVDCCRGQSPRDYGDQIFKPVVTTIVFIHRLRRLHGLGHSLKSHAASTMKEAKLWFLLATSKVLLDGRDVCLEQVRSGMAWHYKYYQAEQSPEDRKLYTDAEVEARATRRGLWTDANPTPPWDFRNGR
jgi:hypothetical protein